MKKNILSQCVNLRLKPKDIERLDIICDEINESKASYIRNALREKMDQYLAPAR